MKFSNSKLFRVVMAAALLVGLSACTFVESGNVGVEKSFGKVTPTALPQGQYITIFDTVTEFSTKEVSFPVNNLSPKSSDNLTLQDLDVDVYFKVRPDAIPGLFVKYAGDYIPHGQIVENSTNPDINVIGYNRVLRAAREATYNAVAKFEATTMHTKRAEIAEEIRKALQEELNGSDPSVFTVTTVNVRNLLTDQAIERAIRARAEMDQEVARALKAKELAIANAAIAVERAKGEAEANSIISASLTGNLLELRLAQIQRDTIVQSAKAGNTVISGTSVAPMMQVR